MASQFELEIRKLLQQNDSTLVADDLLKRWLRGDLSPDDQIIVGNFLLNAGYFTTLKNHYLSLLTQDKYISWIPLLELFNRFAQKINDDNIEQILIGMTEQGNLEELIGVKSFVFAYERLKSIYPKLLEEKVKKIKNEKNELLDKLQRAMNDRLDEEIQKVSQKLREQFPEDQHVQDLVSDLDLARIKNLLKKKEREFQDTKTFKFIDGLEEEKTKLFESVLTASAQNPQHAYDLAILMAQIDAFDEALKCLEFAPASSSKDWLKLELLIHSKNYLTALNESFELEKKYVHKPETIFSTLILRAQALYGLGEKERALQILEKIIEVQPKNQRARFLLHSWRISN